jgi:hypothetical protein
MDHVWVIWEIINLELILIRNVSLLVTWRTFILQFEKLLILITMVLDIESAWYRNGYLWRFWKIDCNDSNGGW